MILLFFFNYKSVNYFRCRFFYNKTKQKHFNILLTYKYISEPVACFYMSIFWHRYFYLTTGCEYFRQDTQSSNATNK